jgi:HD-like signal output (HDOD) protein
MRLADDTDANPREIEKAIEMDPAITAKILKVANSAYYGSSHIPTLGRAISFLGLTTVRSVVISIAMQQMVNGRTHCPSLDKLELWKHSLATAVACRIVAKLKNPGKAEELYCAGMVHEIGLLAMDKFVPQELNAAMTKARESGRPLIEVEQEEIGFTHADAGRVLAARWGLSQLVVNAIQYWHDPYAAEEYFETTAIVALAKALAVSLGFTYSSVACAPELDPELMGHVGIAEEQFAIIGDVVTHEVAKALESFQIAA